MAPFRHLLSPSTEFVWTDDLEEAFVASKKKIIEMIQIGVFAFDMELETCLSTEYLKEGMGWILQQKTCRCAKISPTFVVMDGDWYWPGGGLLQPSRTQL